MSGYYLRTLRKRNLRCFLVDLCKLRSTLLI